MFTPRPRCLGVGRVQSLGAAEDGRFRGRMC